MAPGAPDGQGAPRVPSTLRCRACSSLRRTDVVRVVGDQRQIVKRPDTDAETLVQGHDGDGPATSRDSASASAQRAHVLGRRTYTRHPDAPGARVVRASTRRPISSSDSELVRGSSSLSAGAWSSRAPSALAAAPSARPRRSGRSAGPRRTGRRPRRRKKASSNVAGARLRPGDVKVRWLRCRRSGEQNVGANTGISGICRLASLTPVHRDILADFLAAGPKADGRLPVRIQRDGPRRSEESRGRPTPAQTRAPFGLRYGRICTCLAASSGAPC